MTGCAAFRSAGQTPHCLAGAQPCTGGCDFLLDPDRSASETAIFWRPELVASVLMLEAAPAVFRTARRLEQLALTDAPLPAPRADGSPIFLAHPDGTHSLIAD